MLHGQGWRAIANQQRLQLQPCAQRHRRNIASNHSAQRRMLQQRNAEHAEEVQFNRNAHQAAQRPPYILASFTSE